MKKVSLICIIGLALLSACSEGTGVDSVEDNVPTPNAAYEVSSIEIDGRIVISSAAKIFEPNNCILPITISNGTEEDAQISMMQFKVNGPGEADSGNMFGQTVASGEITTAHIHFPTRQCDELLEISAPNLTCKTDSGSCEDSVVFEPGEKMQFTRVAVEG
jgi:hypothetical protein